MIHPLKKIDGVLKSVNVTGSHLRYEETLVSGFNYSLWWKYEPRPTNGMDDLKKFLAKINTCLDDLRLFPTEAARVKEITDKLSEERAGLQDWFDLGRATFGITWIYSTHYAPDTETARALIQEPELRKIGGIFLGCLLDIGWSPDEAETFYIDKIVPFLYDGGVRRWVDDLNMAVMSDLRYKARQLDKALGDDSDQKRIAGSIRALVAEIPVVGKALEVLIFGVKAKSQ